jgi:protein O-GlcNAc transferase
MSGNFLAALLRQLWRRRHLDARTEIIRAIELLNSGRLQESAEVLRGVCVTHTDNADAWHLLGHILRQQKEYEGALKALQRATALKPGNADMAFSLGDAWRAAGDKQSAASAFRRATLLNPDAAAAWLALADVLACLDEVDEAETFYLRALELAPEFAEAHYNFGNLLHRCGRIDDAIGRYRRAVALKPGFVRAHSNLVYALNFSDRYTKEQIRAEHIEWAGKHAAPFVSKAEPMRRTPRTTPIRVGYVSANFREHAVTYFLEPVLRHHDRKRFAVYCYSDVSESDATTARLKQYDSTWRDISEATDDEVAHLIRTDEIDLLVDLSGHTDNHRLLVFARQPAPVQLTWNGYANTTGLSTIEYRIADAHTDPPGWTEQLHSECLLRMPEVYMVFEPPRASPPVSALPALKRGYVTFGSLNATAKLSERTLGIWSCLLNAMPSSRLVLLTVPEGKTRERIALAFSNRGVDVGRLEFKPRLPFAQFLMACGDVDIALDPFPFHGTTTTCHSLWMGVPVITLAGDSHVSRVGVSFLSNVGLQSLVAESEDAYIACAKALGSNLAELAALRAGLRTRMLKSPLCDGPRFTAALEQAFDRIWRHQTRGTAHDLARIHAYGS